MRHFLIDTDTASDDAVALVMALTYPDVQVEAITVVAGNVPLDQGVQNALYTVEMCDSQAPVYPGLAHPMLRPLETAQFVHGQDGMGDIGLPLHGRIPAGAVGSATQVIIDTIHRFAGDITLVTLGPLSNIAAALLHDPTIAGEVDRCIIMGGTGRGYGNMTPVAEYNIWVDPEAAHIVFESGLPITMVGWDISYIHATFSPTDSDALRAIGTPLAHYCVDIQRIVNQFAIEVTQLEGYDLPDPIAMAVALDSTVATRSDRLHVSIETQSQLCRGQTVVDHLRLTGNEPKVEVIFEASRERFLEMLHAAVRTAAR
jgi:purine nucleosidase